MKYLIFNILSLILIALNCSAKNSTPIKIKIGTETHNFFENRKIAVLTSKNCGNLKKDKLCDYLKFLEDLTVDTKELKGQGSLNFGSLACTDVLKKKVFLGHDPKGNEITFCKIGDYYLDLATLSYYVEKNLGLISNSRHRKK